ncbi:MAG: biotin/lipoyl-binding protein, partial [Chloroflexota bacterium]|nr:biotin/lipoyl-binding protein [Chloroflexota bacterium]
MNSGNDRSNNRVVPRWIVVLGILVIMGIVVYGLARIVLPMQQASNQQFSESSGEFNRGSGERGRVGRGRGPFGFVQRLFRGGPSEEELVETGEVVLLDAERIIDASGTLIASQSGEIYWETSGIVGKVMVEVGDDVRKGDVLLELDPLSAPQNVIMAQADLISARKDLDELLNPTDLQISNAQKSVADAIEELDNMQNPTTSSVAQAKQAVADARDALDELKSPSAAQIASAEQEIASKKDALRDQQEALDDLLNPDIEALRDTLRDAEFDLARAEQDVELADIGTATSALQNALDTLEDMKERQVSVQKAVDGCVINKVEEEDDRDYIQLTVTEELVYKGYTYLVGPVYQVFEETGNVLKDTYGNIVEHQLFRICDSTRAVSVDGVTRT